jgi:MoaA/NifB/PqqE/SkfB family radical SAM enzyme
MRRKKPISEVFLLGRDTIAVTGEVAWVFVNNRWVELGGRFADELDSVLHGKPGSSGLSLLGSVKLKEAKQIVQLLKSEPARPVVPELTVENPSLLFLELTDACNLQCKHCYAGASPGLDTTMDSSLAIAIIEDAARMRFKRIQLTGGEPLMHPKLVELAETAFDRGIDEVEIFTNGNLLTQTLLEALPPRTSFALSFYSSNLEVHDRITGVEGSGALTLFAMDLIMKTQFRMRIGTVLMEENVDDWPQTFHFLINRGIDPGSLRATATSNVGRGDWQPLPLDLDMPCVDETEQDEVTNFAVWPGKAAVSASGEVYPCIFARWLGLGNIHERSLPDILRNPRGVSGPKMPVPERWQYCSERLSCPDCRLLAFTLLGQQL